MEIKGILHAHSTYSYDAKLTLRELRELCVKNNVQFVCMTEHTDEMSADSARAFVDECEALSDATFRFIPGFEVPYKMNAGGGEGTIDHAHILMIGMRSFYERYAPTIAELAPWTNEAQFVILAHPVRNHFEVDPGLLNVIDGLEVWNQQYEGKRVPRTRSLALLTELRKKKTSLTATGGVDFHRTEHFGAPFVTLNIDDFSEEAILRKLQEGAFTVCSERVQFLGIVPNPNELIQHHRFESAVSVTIIVLGKFVNKSLASLGLTLPRSLKQLVRRRL